MNFYKRHIGDYIKDASHLTLLEHGVYSRLMDVYYTRESGIPDGQAARLIGARSDEEIEAVSNVLLEFFKLKDSVWIQTRCEKEISEASKKADANRENGKMGGRPKRIETEEKPIGFPVDTEMGTQNNLSQTPDTRHQTPEVKKKRNAGKPSICSADLVSQGVKESAAAEWLEIRKRKRLPLTPLAWESFVAEAGKAGWTLDDAVMKCISRGWATFEAEWVVRESRQQGFGMPAMNKQEALEANNRAIAERLAKKYEQVTYDAQ